MIGPHSIGFKRMNVIRETNMSLSSSVLLLLVLASCNVLSDPDRTQCSANTDCVARGFEGGVCVAGLCQAMSGTTGTGTMTGSSGTSAGAGAGAISGAASAPTRPAPSGSGGASTGPSTSSEAGASAGSASEPGPDAASGNPAGAGGGSATTAGVGGESPAGSGAAGAAEGGGSGRGGSGGEGGQGGDAATAGAEAETPCTGEGCPECAVDADCEMRGVAGGRCADAVCWAPEAQCSKDDECVSLGPEFDGGRCVSTLCRPNPRWRCEPPPPPMASSGTQDLKMLVRDSLSLSALADVRVVACQKLDVTCANPMTEATTGRDGYLTITLPVGFAGYLQQTDRREYAPAMYFLPQAFPANGELQPFPLLQSGLIIDSLAIVLGAGLDDTRGHMMLIAEDCFGAALAGVQFSTPQADDESVQFYVRDLLPSTSAKETAEVGNGGFLNFAAGTAVLNLEMAATKLKLNTVSVVVRPKFISVAYIRPELR
ncbi:MAG: hypothetical protein ABW321_33825 [Polyangiales bacterium]